MHSALALGIVSSLLRGGGGEREGGRILIF